MDEAEDRTDMSGHVIVIRKEPSGYQAEVFPVGEAPMLAVIALLEDAAAPDKPTPTPFRQVRTLVWLRVRREPWGAVVSSVRPGTVLAVFDQVEGQPREGKGSTWLGIESGSWICERWGQQRYVVDHA
jgi:hypothetical protein